MYSEVTGDKEKQIFIRDDCKICRKFTFDFPENVKHHILGIPHLNDILEKRKNFTQNKSSLSFLPIDLRKEKKDGILSKSHLVDFSNFHDKIAYDLIDVFIEFKDIYHFSFFANNNDYCYVENKEKNKKNFNEKFFTQPDEVFGKSLKFFIKNNVFLDFDENYCLKKFTNDFIDNGFSYVSIVEGGFLVIILYFL